MIVFPLAMNPPAYIGFSHFIVRLIALTSAAAALTACMTTLHADTTMWHGKKVAVAVYPPSSLQIAGMGAEFAVGATKGMVEPGTAAGAKVQAKNAIEDPALRVAQALLGAAKKQYDVTVVPDISMPRPGNPTELAGAAHGVDLLLDVTSSSTVVQRPFSSRYWVNTNMFGRLIEVPSGKVLADSFCQRVFGGDPEPLTYDELIANSAARLKAILAREAEACLDKFKVDVLGIHAPAAT